MLKKIFDKKGFIPPVVLILVGVITISFLVIYKNIPQDMPAQNFSENIASDSAKQSLSPQKTQKADQSAKKTAPTPTPTPTPSSNNKAENNNIQNTPSNNSSSSTNNSSQQTATPTPTPTPSATATPTSTPINNEKSYSISSDGINVSLKCTIPNTTPVSISVNGSVAVKNYGDGVWTTLTGEGNTIIVSYDNGNYPSTSGLSFNFGSGTVTSIRYQPSITLKGDNSSYTIEAHSAPFTNSTPSLSASTRIGSVNFAIDCTKN